MPRMSFAQLLVTQLRDLGVERIYGVVGDSLNPVVDAVRTTEGIEWVHVRNEEAGAFAAGAEARLTGKLAVCAGSCGPGNTHMIQGLYDAHRDGAPVLAIASHIPSAKIGTGFFQETHPEILFQECSHFCEMVNSGPHGATMLHIAVQTAIAKSGVSVLVLPGDVADQQVDGPLTKELATDLGRVQPAAGPVGRLAELIDEAEHRHPVHRGWRARRPRGGARARRAGQGTDRPRLRRQGVHAVRQSVRRGHERPARLRRLLRRDARGGSGDPAGHRLPLQRVPARARAARTRRRSCRSTPTPRGWADGCRWTSRSTATWH